MAILIVPDDYATIQAAVEAAQVGDSVLIRDGEYKENVTVDKVLHCLSPFEPSPDMGVHIQAVDPTKPALEFKPNCVPGNHGGFTIIAAEGQQKTDEQILAYIVELATVEQVEYFRTVDMRPGSCAHFLDTKNIWLDVIRRVCEYVEQREE